MCLGGDGCVGVLIPLCVWVGVYMCNVVGL